jgi:hypothetical protein
VKRLGSVEPGVLADLAQRLEAGAHVVPQTEAEKACFDILKDLDQEKYILKHRIGFSIARHVTQNWDSKETHFEARDSSLTKIPLSKFFMSSFWDLLITCTIVPLEPGHPRKNLQYQLIRFSWYQVE